MRSFLNRALSLLVVLGTLSLTVLAQSPSRDEILNDLKAKHYSDSEVLVAFRVGRKDTDGSLIKVPQTGTGAE